MMVEPQWSGLIITFMSILSKDLVEEFQTLVQDEFYVAMTYTEAEQRLLELADLFSLLLDESEAPGMD